MADAPAATPAPAAAPVAAAPPPNTSPPQAPPQNRQPAATPPPDIDFDTPIEYDDGKGGFKRATYGELIKAHEKVSGMGNLDQINDLAAALGNDPAATERVLRRQLADIEAAKAKQTPQGNQEVAELRAQLEEIKSQLAQSSRVTQTIEDQQHEATLENLLSRPGVREKLPYLAAKAKNGARVALTFVKSYKQQVEKAGGQWSNQHLLQALSAAEQQHRSMLEPYGIDPAKLMMPATPGNPAVSAVNNGNTNSPNVVREPLDTPDSLLRGRMPVPMVNAPQPVGNHVPEPGGSIGGSPAGNAGGQPSRYHHDGLVQKLKAQRAANGGGA